MKIKQVVLNDRPKLIQLFESITIFTPDEQEVIKELLDTYLYNPNQKDYIFFVTQEDDQAFSSFICFGPTPMTKETYDLYWVGTSPHHRRKGLAKKLIEFMMEYMRERGGSIMRIETSGQDSYNETVAFYNGLNFTEEARIKDFYKKGDDLIVYICRL